MTPFRSRQFGAAAGVLLAICMLVFSHCALAADGESDKTEFTSGPAVAARARYRLATDQAWKSMVGELHIALKETMQAGQLDEANRISKLIESDAATEAEGLTSGKAKAAYGRYKTASQRATTEYASALKAALNQSLRTAQLDESNRIAAELKKFETLAAREPSAKGGMINLLPLIDPVKDAIAGKWALEKGELVSSGKGQERIEIPYEPPAEYDYQITYTKTGTNCVIQMLSEVGTPFIWVMGATGSFTFHYVKGAGIGANKTTVQKPPGVKDKHRYTSLVRVRKSGAEALLEGKMITKWPTDFSDAVPAPFWALRNNKLLGLGTADSKTVFHTIEVKEVSGPGKFQR